ncbi:MAG: PspC domain-containing protein [Bacteroidales bacterium]|nr:PspC domain-containing protein [Bacteroides sp.]MCM1197558.1 PspC domain-containing protein [Clostridium sp.]MCM1502226.1 PspC domain-containing protein [Bacteroidales bacterium]
MKKTVSAAIGGRNFIIDEDAYNALGNYLDSFQSGLENTNSRQEVMDELEMRIADLFQEKMAGKEVVGISMVNDIVKQLGMPDWKAVNVNGGTGNRGNDGRSYSAEEDMGGYGTRKKFYRDPDDKMIGGVCSGLAIHLNIDVALVRVLFVLALICGTAGFWIYIIICIIAPCARTAAEKCAMRGIPATAENIRYFSGNNYSR